MITNKTLWKLTSSYPKFGVCPGLVLRVLLGVSIGKRGLSMVPVGGKALFMTPVGGRI